ncbi:RNA-directed DNA polymerase, eukaryota [Tanacetum coccineum]
MENSLSKRRSEGLSSHVLEDAQPLNVHVSPSINSKKKQVARYWRASDQMVSETWNNIDHDDNNKMDRFKKKLQILKKEIRSWVNDCKKKSISSFSRGCNSSFIALIPKNHDPKFVNDYRPISLIGSLYKVVTKILATRLSSIISGLISDVQTAFLPNRQILDGPFIINELLSWCKHKKQQAMVFKVDFAKAYDSIRWDFLEDVLRAFGFGSKWCSWIRGCLHSGMASVLLNGSPTSEFQFHCGLKQGDPLAPYLFILIMESLHL